MKAALGFDVERIFTSSSVEGARAVVRPAVASLATACEIQMEQEATQSFLIDNTPAHYDAARLP